MAHTTSIAVIVALALASPVSTMAADNCENRGFLVNPPVFVNSFPDFPLAGMGIDMPPVGQTVPDFDSSSLRSHGWRQGGQDVQPALGVKYTTVRIGALRGLSERLAAGISAPWRQTQVLGGIGGQTATSTAQGLGGIMLGAKTVLREFGPTERITASLALELPNGPDSVSFYQTNSSTTGYYGVPRLPLSWQPSSGTWNMYLAAAYGKKAERISYMGIAAAKFYTAGDEDVNIGNILIGAATATYGVSRNLALSLGATLRTQGDDSYPQAPPPGVDQPALAGTTSNGTTLYVSPSIRFTVMNSVTVGLGYNIPVILPDDGMVPSTTVSLIFYPSF